MHSAGEDGTEGDPQEHNRSPHGTGQGAEDGAEAGNVQKLNHKQLPLGHDDVVNAVVDGDCGGLAVVGREGLVYKLAVEQVSTYKYSQAQEKANHFFSSSYTEKYVPDIYKMFISMNPILVHYYKKIKYYV